MMNQLCPSRDELRQLIAAREGSPIDHRWDDHVAGCPECQHRLDALAASDDQWREAASLLSSVEIPNVTRHFAPPGGDSPTAMIRPIREGAGQDWSGVLAPPAHPELLGRIGRYEVESFLGQGGFGAVFKAQDGDLNRPVAIKVLAPHLAHHGAARKRFAREAQAAAAINHPNVVPIHAVAAEAEIPFLVMTYVPGHTLQEVVDREGPLDARSIVRIGCQVAAGLDAAHRQGLVHRDIKPANILLENDVQRALITDFGLARAADDAALTRSGWLAGTPFYMSPEQAQGRDIDARSDLFSLGSVLYFLATGREPFRADQPLGVLQKIINERPLPVRAVNADIPLPLAQLIERLLEKRPLDRLQSAEEVREWLEQYLAYLQRPQDFREPRLRMAPKGWRRIQRLALVCAAGCVAILAGYWGAQSWLTGLHVPATADLPPSPAASPEYWEECLAEQMAEAAAWQEFDLSLADMHYALREFHWSDVDCPPDLATDPAMDPFVTEYKEILSAIERLEEAWQF